MQTLVEHLFPLFSLPKQQEKVRVSSDQYHHSQFSLQYHFESWIHKSSDQYLSHRWVRDSDEYLIGVVGVVKGWIVEVE